MFGSTKFPFSGSGFGSTTTTTSSSTGGLFSSSLFSTPATTTSSSSTFGGLGFGSLGGSATFGSSNAFKPATSSAFGLSTALVPVSNAGTTIKYEPVISTDMMKKGAINQKQSIKFIAITAMTQYQSKSFEELRLEDYAANRKTSSALTLFKPAIGSSSPFGSAVSSSGSSWFNKSFGGLTSTATTTSAPSVFGSSTTSKPLFQSGTFGLNTSLTTTTASSTGFSFGTPATTTQSSIFGQPSTTGGLFSTPTTTSTFSLFGSSTTTTTTSGGLFSFGSATTTTTSSGTTGGLFGQKPLGSSPFGSSLFSSTPAAATTTTTASPFSFGLSKPSTGIFGQPTTSSSSFSFGQPTSNQATTASSSIFGTPTAAAAASTSTAASPAGALLLLSAAKEKDPEVMRRSAQMLLRAQCFSYSNDPIFQDFTPSTTDSASAGSAKRGSVLSDPLSSNVVVAAERKTPEPLGRRVRSLLLSPSATMNVEGLYQPLDRSQSFQVRGGRSLDLKRLVLPTSVKAEQPFSMRRHESRSSSDRTLGEFLQNSRGSFLDTTAETKVEEEDRTVPCCKLTRPGYNTDPSLDKLSPDPMTGSCLVPNFSIFRDGYGSITWPGLTDIAGLDLDAIVFIRRKEVIVYPDDDSKPPVNEGLNKPAEITLHYVFPLDKKTRQPIKDRSRLEEMNYGRFLEEATLRIGGQFVDYDVTNGSWTFRVDHFTRYGLDYTDEPPERGVALSQNMLRWQNKLEKQVPLESGLLGASPFAPDAFSTVLNEKEEKIEETVPVKDLTRRMESMASDFSKEDEDIDEFMPESPGLADVSCFNVERFAPFWIPWENSLFNTDRNLLWDAAFLKGRTFRFNIVGAKRTCFPRATNSLITLNWTEFCNLPSQKDGDTASLDWLLTSQFSRKELDPLDKPYPLIRVKQFQEYAQQLANPPHDISGEALAHRIKSSTHLLQILFHRQINSRDRKQQLIRWLLDAKGPPPNTTSNSDPSAVILDALFNLDQKLAVATALSAKYFRLAQLLSIPPGHAAVQNLLKTQLVHWCENEADQFIDKDLLKIYLLLSGELFIELSNGGFLSIISDKSWLENLIVILRYSCQFDAPCNNAIILLDNLMKSGLCPPSDDYRWNILKFSIDPATANMAELLQPVEFFQSEDYRLSWHLLQAIQGLSVVAVPHGLSTQLCQEFSRQLEAMGRSDWAAYVLSHVEPPHVREVLCDSFLQRIACADHDCTRVEGWLVQQLGWSSQRVHRAKSYRAQYEKNWFLCCDHRLQSEDFAGALSILFDKLLPEAFFKDDRSDVVQLLDLMNDHVDRGTFVEGWIHSGQFLHQYFKAQLKFAAPKTWSTDQAELLQFGEAIALEFDALAKRFPDVSTEEKIATWILRMIAEGICSSMRLLCKWVADGTYQQTEEREKAIKIIDASETIFANTSRMSYSK